MSEQLKKRQLNKLKFEREFLFFVIVAAAAILFCPKNVYAQSSIDNGVAAATDILNSNNFVRSLFVGFDYTPYIYGALPENSDDNGYKELPEHARALLLAKSRLGVRYDAAVLPRVRNSKGQDVLAEIIVYNSQEGSFGPRTPNLTPANGKKFDVEMTFPGRFNALKFQGMSYNSSRDIRIEDLQPDRLSLPGKRNMKIYAMDLSGLNFSSGMYYDVAEGRELWKCRDWSFENQTCYGSWQKIMDIVPGREYSFPVSPVDPAYVEVFDLNSSIDMDIAALDNETIVLAWVDGDTNNYVSFEVWNTRGIRLVDQVDVDTSGDSGSDVAVSSLNSSHFTIGWIDSPLDDLRHAGYLFNGANFIASAALDTGAGTIANVDICQLGDRYVVASAGNDDSDADFWIRNNANGASLVGETAADGTISPGANNQNLVSCSVINSTLWAYAFFDDADNDASVFLRNFAGTAVGAVLDVDTNVGETGQVAVAGLRYNRYAYVYYDSVDSAVYRSVRSMTSAGAHTTILANTAVDTNAGNDSRVDVAEIEFSGGSYFVVAWFDQSDTTIKAGVYNGSGAQITAPFTVTSTPTASYPMVSVTGTYSALGFGLCNGTFAIAYTNSSGNTVFETYWYNSTRWNGTCPGEDDTAAPNVTIISPANNTVNTTSPTIEFFYNVTDNSAYVNCSFYIDGSINQTAELVSKGVTLNFSTDVPNGNHTWEIRCTDLFGNIGLSGLYNLNVSVFFYSNNAIDIDIDALDSETLVMAWISGDTNNYLSFEVWNTNGTRMLNQVDVDTSGDSGSAVAVSSLNSSHFVIGWIDSPLDDLRHAGYIADGSSFIASAALDTGIGAFSDVDVCQLGDRYAVVNANAADSDADFRIRSNTGASLVGEVAADGTITPEANNQNLVSCSVINSNLWAYAFYDDADNDASVFLRNFAGTAVGAVLDVDTDVGETGQVAVAGLRNDSYAYVYYDSADDAVYMSVRGYSGSAHTTVLDNTVVDSDAGNDSRVDVAEIEFSGGSYFAVAWFDQSDTTIKVGVYNGSGAEVTAPFNVTLEPSELSPIVSLTGTHSALGFGLCEGTFSIGYTNSSGYAVFRTYWYNGTRWNGTCVDFNPPVVTLLNPPDNAYNKSTGMITFQYSVNDYSNVSNCSIYINDALNQTNSSIEKGSTMSITVNMSNGNFSWKISCSDSFGNTGNSSSRNLNVSWYTPEIQQMYMEPLVILNAGSVKRMDCNTTVYEGNGFADISLVNGTFFRANTSEAGADNNNVHYTNASCASTGSEGNFSNYTCSFYLYYYASNGTWNCSINAYDEDNWEDNLKNSTEVDELYALNLSAVIIDYGQVSPGLNSSDKTVNITNYGNMPLNITVYGYGGDDPVSGDGYAMTCISGDNITIGNQRYSEIFGRTFAQKKQLTSTAQHLNLTIQKQTLPSSLRMNSTYWQLYVPPMAAVTRCNGTVVFTVAAP